MTSTTSAPTASSTTLSTRVQETVAATANSFASARGLEIEKPHKDGVGKYFEAAPVSLLPNAFPQVCFKRAQSLAPAWNLLVDRISHDASFLTATLQGVVQADPYTRKLLELYQEIYVNPETQNAPAMTADRLGIHRSDYMLHTGIQKSTEDNDDWLLKQVELNTIASSFGSLACQVAAMHSFLTQRYKRQVADFLKSNIDIVMAGKNPATNDDDTGVPVNKALEGLALAMSKTVERYQQRHGVKKNAIILFVVSGNESNTVDQRMLEFQLWQGHRIPVVRLSLDKITTRVKTRAEDGALILLNEDGEDGENEEIALVYYRAGYAPTDYPDGYDGIEWQARRQLEMSRATKSPCLGYHLAGTKKVQQALARPGAVEQFFNLDDPTEKEMVQQMRGSFAGLYSLGSSSSLGGQDTDVTEEDLAAIADVLFNDGAEEKYVLKPQREGGGYNFYGKDLKEKLLQNVTFDKETKTVQTLSPYLSEYILMERLFPPLQPAILMRSGRVEGTGDTISELGCFGTILCSSTSSKDKTVSDVLHNEYAGFLLRTKFAHVNEGGVASGFATLSSPYLC